MQVNIFIAEASTLANKAALSKAEERRFSFLLSAISSLRSGRSIEEVQNDYRNEQLVRLGELPASVSARKSEERSRLMESLKEIGIKRGYREKVLAKLRPDLS